MDTNVGLMVLMAIILSTITMKFGYEVGHWKGMVDLASGIYQCELVDNRDRTTQWECQPDEEVE